jgi:1-acyl-sn-glycerol-3-phosphate acyltransferase
VPRLAKSRTRGPREALGPWWLVTNGLLYLPVSALFRVKYRGIEGLPLEGPVILVANHVSHADPFIVSKFVLDAGRVPRFLAKESLFRGRVSGLFMRRMGHIPVNRNSVDPLHALDPAIAALQAGRVVLMYPEGTVTRDPDGWPMTGRLGTAQLALAMPDVPVIPLGQWGVQRSIDLYRRRIRLLPRPIHEIALGKPVDLTAFRREPASAATLLRMTDVIMRDVRSLVADLRGVPNPTGSFYRLRRSAGALPRENQ